MNSVVDLHLPKGFTYQPELSKIQGSIPDITVQTTGHKTFSYEVTTPLLFQLHSGKLGSQKRRNGLNSLPFPPGQVVNNHAREAVSLLYPGSGWGRDSRLGPVPLPGEESAF